MDRFSYVMPTVCVLPFTMLLSLAMCQAKSSEDCYFAHLLPDSASLIL